MSGYRRLGRIRKRYLRQLRIQIEPQLRERRTAFLQERRARRAWTPQEQFDELRRGHERGRRA